MAFFAGEYGGQKRLGQLGGQALAHHPGPQAQQVDIVVFHHLMGGVVVVGHRRPDPGQFVGGDGRPRSRSAHGDAPFRRPGAHRLPYRRRRIRVVHRLLRMGSQIGHLITQSLQMFH